MNARALVVLAAMLWALPVAAAPVLPRRRVPMAFWSWLMAAARNGIRRCCRPWSRSGSRSRSRSPSGWRTPALSQAAVGKLEAQGVRKIGVVRLFVSGESFYKETQQVLGLQEGAPTRRRCHAEIKAAHPGGSGMEMDMSFFQIDSHSSFALSRQGLAEAPEMGGILADRPRRSARSRSRRTSSFSPTAPETIRRTSDGWRTSAAARPRSGKVAPFHHVEVWTLREDWPEKRKAAEQGIRDFVSQNASEGRKTIVIPFRVEGFGPYKDVLSGLQYVSDGRGLLPHENLTRWIARQSEELRGGAFQTSRAAEAPQPLPQGKK